MNIHRNEDDVFPGRAEAVAQSIHSHKSAKAFIVITYINSRFIFRRNFFYFLAAAAAAAADAAWGNDIGHSDDDNDNNDNSQVPTRKKKIVCFFARISHTSADYMIIMMEYSPVYVG